MSPKESLLEAIRRMPDNCSATDVLALLGRRASANGPEDDRVDPLHYGIETLSLIGQVDEHHRLTAEVPAAVSPGPVKVLLILCTDEELSAAQWSSGVGRMWALDWDDPREAIYTLEEGEPPDGTR